MLNILQEEQIRLLRSQGVGYRQIANRLNLSRDAVRYYCKANDLNGHREAVLSNTQCIKTTALAPPNYHEKYRLFYPSFM